MQQINPQSDFPIVRQLEDPADSTTLYVQAVIRDSATGVTLDTINLTDQGNQRFTGSWRSSADTSGEGLVVDIETTVYTNSGYTTKSNNYRIVSQEYLVMQRIHRGMLGGGGVGVDYKRLRAIVQEEIKKAPKGQRVDLSGVLGAVATAQKAIEGIKMPEIKETDLSGILTAIENAKAAVVTEVGKIEIPEKVDEEAIANQILGVDTSVKEMEGNVEKKVEQALEEGVAKMKEGNEERIKEIKDALVEALTNVMPKALAQEIIFGDRKKETMQIKTKLGKRR